jgi:hypothetical protein
MGSIGTLRLTEASNRKDGVGRAVSSTIEIAVPNNIRKLCRSVLVNQATANGMVQANDDAHAMKYMGGWGAYGVGC